MALISGEKIMKITITSSSGASVDFEVKNSIKFSREYLQDLHKEYEDALNKFEAAMEGMYCTDISELDWDKRRKLWIEEFNTVCRISRKLGACNYPLDDKEFYVRPEKLKE